MIGDLATRLAGQTVGIEAHVLTVASHEQLREGGVETMSRTGIVERLRAVKEPAEIESMREAAAISDRVFAALAEEQFTGRTEIELAWRVRELFHEHGSSELSFDTIVAAAENGASPHADVRDVADPGEHARHDRRRLPRRRLRLRLHAHVRDGRPPGRARARLRGLPGGAARRRSTRTAPASAAATPTPPPAT